MPGRAVPCIPSPTSPAAWQCPPHPVPVSSVPLCPLQLVTSCGEWPPQPSRPAPPARGAFPPSTAPAAAQGPLPHQLYRGAPAPGPGSPRRLPQLTPLAPVPRRPRRARPGLSAYLELGARSWDKGCPAGVALPLATDQQPAQESACPGGSGAGAGQPGWKEHSGLTTSLLEERHSPGAGGLRCPRRQATDRRQPLPPEPASALPQDVAAAELREPQTALPELWHKHREGPRLPCHPAATRLCRTPPPSCCR